MAAGKTTVGRLLAQQLGWPFLDADIEIEAAAGLTVPEIFRVHGEPWFRELEHSTIRGLLAQEPVVLAMGGGAIEDPRTRALLLGSGSEPKPCSVHLVNLEATLETTLARCGPADSAASTRPVLADLANLENRYHSRQPLYRQAHQTIQVDSLNPFEVAEAIRLHLYLELPSRQPAESTP